MRYNKDTESKARRLEDLDFNKVQTQPIDKDRLERALIAAGWSPEFFTHTNQ
jgi:hypothetical protein